MRRYSLRRLEEGYFGADWEHKENANTNVSFGGFVGFVFSKLMRTGHILREVLPGEAVSLHADGAVYIHKLPLSLWIPYCAGWNLGMLYRQGIRSMSVRSRPARHFDTAVSHLVNFFYLTANEWSGAQAVGSLDLYLAAFARRDNASRRFIRQSLQRLVFELNYPSRIGYQSPFTNATLSLDTLRTMLGAPAYVGGEEVGVLGDYLEEAVVVAEELLSLFLGGDADGKPFTFPILTMMITPRFDWEGKRWGGLTDLLFEVLAKRGSFYLLNGYAVDVEGLYAMCCRLTIDTKKLSSIGFSVARDEEEDRYEALRKRRGPHGVWAMPDATGSIGVVTLNLPRAAFLSRGYIDLFYDKLLSWLRVARSVFDVWRIRYEKALRGGLMPLTAQFLGGFHAHYNTIGLVGLPEAAMHLVGVGPDDWETHGKELVMVMKNIVYYIRQVVEEWMEENGTLWNVEEVPAESAAYKLAMKDIQLFWPSAKRGDIFIPILNGEPIYSNSIVPYYVDVPLHRRVEWESEVQPEFSGGVMAHLFLGEATDPRALKKFVRSIVENTKIAYFSITPVLSFCEKCGWRGIGTYETCPNCGAETEVWSRIVGYYRPVKMWNRGRRAEFKMRKHYRIA